MPPNNIRDHAGRLANQIDDGHWQSGFPMPFVDLPSHGIDLVVLSAKEAQPGGEDLEFIKGKCPSLSIIKVPIDDTEDPAALPRIVEIAQSVAKRVAQRLDEGKTVLVTCAAGLNRSGLISALVLVERRGLSGAEAAEVVRKNRWMALSNRSFSAFLESVPKKMTAD